MLLLLVQPARYRRGPTQGSEALYAHAQYDTQPVAIEGPWHLHGVMPAYEFRRGFCTFIVIYCYHGDGSDGRRVCTKYHGHMYMYVCTTISNFIGCYSMLLYSLRLFVVGGEHIQMVVVGQYGCIQHYLLVI